MLPRGKLSADLHTARRVSPQALCSRRRFPARTRAGPERHGLLTGMQSCLGRLHRPAIGLVLLRGWSAPACGRRAGTSRA